MTPADRLNTILDHYNSNASRMATEIGHTNKSSMYHILNGVVKEISPRIAEDICRRYPKVSYEFLIGMTDEPFVDPNQMGHMMQKKIFNELAEMKSVMAKVLEILEKQ